jgi:hypothetical protein
VPAQTASGVILRFGEQRLIIRHSLGFPLVDWHSPVPIGRREITIELASLGANGVILDHRSRRSARRKLPRLTRAIPDACGSNQDLRRFLQFILPYIRWRLSDALAQGGMSLKTGAATLLRRWGQLYVTSTHVDLVMDLKHVSLPVRVAGLDANPGWVPELGRVITFHYR